MRRGLLYKHETKYLATAKLKYIDSYGITTKLEFTSYSSHRINIKNQITENLKQVLSAYE